MVERTEEEKQFFDAALERILLYTQAMIAWTDIYMALHHEMATDTVNRIFGHMTQDQYDAAYAKYYRGAS